MLHYLNNCNNYNHAKQYGGDAFYDLWATGNDEKYIQDFKTGDECIVASKISIASRSSAEEIVQLTRYRFERFRREKYNDHGKERDTLVLCGPRLASERMTKAEAAYNPKYKRFFNVKGHFKQLSVIRDV